MSVTSNVSEDGNRVMINVAGRFDFRAHRAFRAAFKQGTRGESSYVVDLSDTDYLDSSALAMLLMLREHAGGDRARVEIRNCREDVREILAIANFQKLFEIG